MAIDPVRLLNEAKAISSSSARIKTFALDAATCIGELLARVEALEQKTIPVPANATSTAQLPLLLKG